VAKGGLHDEVSVHGLGVQDAVLHTQQDTRTGSRLNT
jgi:hypothetical protein